MGRQLHFVGYCTIGPSWHSNGSWRHDESDGIDFLNPSRYENIARILEDGKFDGLFFVDVQTLYDTFGGVFDPCVKYGGHMCMLDPLQMLTAMARATKHIGLSATLSTSLHHPFHIARALASLDHISGGRAAWNIVTSASDREAQNYGMDRLMDKAERYDHADEVVEACGMLWDSWEDGALVLDRKAGIFGDPSKVHRADYKGKYIKTRGPLVTPRSPQGSPVLMQAGSSERGRKFAARWAEIIFTLQSDKADMKAFYRDIKDRVSNAGRDPSHCAILPATDIVIGETESIARARADHINALANAELGLSEMSNHIGIDLSGFPMDQPLSDMDITQGARGVFDVIMSGGKGRTLRDAGYQYATTQMSPQLIGTPMMIADHIHELFEDEACDGFVICPSITPGSYFQFVKSVVPELQRRGIFRKEYTGRTFRENLRT